MSMRGGPKLFFALILTSMNIIVAVMPVHHAIFNAIPVILAMQGGTAVMNQTMPDIVALPATLLNYSMIVYIIMPLMCVLSWAIWIYDAVSENKYSSQYQEGGPFVQGMQKP